MSIDVEALFKAHAPGLLAYVARRVPSSTAEDVVAETFAVALRDSGAFDARRGSARGWLFGIATNLLRHEWRSAERSGRLAQRGGTAEPDWSDVADGVAERIDARRDVAALADVLRTLADDDKDLLLLVAWADMTSTVAAGVLGIPAGTARSRLHRIRRSLKAELMHHTAQQIGAQS